MASSIPSLIIMLIGICFFCNSFERSAFLRGSVDLYFNKDSDKKCQKQAKKRNTVRFIGVPLYLYNACFMDL